MSEEKKEILEKAIKDVRVELREATAAIKRKDYHIAYACLDHVRRVVIKVGFER